MKKLTNLFFGVLLAFIVPSIGHALCVMDDLKVRSVSGQVFFATKAREEVAQGAIVMLTRYRDATTIIGQQTVDHSGRFDFGKVRPGLYSIVAKSQITPCALQVDIKVRRPTRKRKDIVLSLGFGFTGCCGNAAELRNSAAV
jgi:hypothetical protein